MTTKKNYYVCLRFQGKPSLHLTLSYMKNLTPGQMAELTTKVNSIVKGHLKGGQFPARFNLEAWYGPRHTVRVLGPKSTQVWPDWVLALTQLEGRDQTYKWHPHIACQDKALNLKIIAVSLMCKKVEVARWDLT